jgi:hypothetical protein
MTASELCVQSLQEVGAVGLGQTANSALVELVLARLNILLDLWNARQHAVYANTLTAYTLTPSLQPHTIGPTGTFVVTQRPVSIEHASLILTSGSRDPIDIVDDATFARLSLPTMTSANPSLLNYRATWPNGSLYFWPVPTSAYQVELLTRVLLVALALDDTFTLPPGYHAAVMLTLAEDICAPIGREVPSKTARGAQEARATIFGNNDVTPRLCTIDGGMPSGDPGWFDYQTGMSR